MLLLTLHVSGPYWPIIRAVLGCLFMLPFGSCSAAVCPCVRGRWSCRTHVGWEVTYTIKTYNWLHLLETFILWSIEDARYRKPKIKWISRFFMLSVATSKRYWKTMNKIRPTIKNMKPSHSVRLFLVPRCIQPSNLTSEHTERNLRHTDHVEDLGTNWKIILKLIFKE
jgi:hypothetical protein